MTDPRIPPQVADGVAALRQIVDAFGRVKDDPEWLARRMMRDMAEVFEVDVSGEELQALSGENATRFVSGMLESIDETRRMLDDLRSCLDGRNAEEWESGAAAAYLSPVDVGTLEYWAQPNDAPVFGMLRLPDAALHEIARRCGVLAEWLAAYLERHRDPS